jgi:hypothetical protein
VVTEQITKDIKEHRHARKGIVTSYTVMHTLVHSAVAKVYI